MHVLYEDNHLLAVHKPAGLLVQGDASGRRCLLDLARDYLREKYQKPGNVYVGLVHRLDRDVSGVVVLARTSKAASRLSAALRERRVEKLYRALVEGSLPLGERREVTHGYLERGETVELVPAETPGAKRAELRFEVRAVARGLSLLAVELGTGRKHQIRRQLAALGHPLVGDLRYGARSQRPAGWDDALGNGLTSVKMAFEHPTAGRRVEVALSPELDPQGPVLAALALAAPLPW
jgi:23S rRNA pseudouridine1911/1915/1917 synthase